MIQTESKFRISRTESRFGWFLNILGCVGYVVVIVDEAVLVAEHMLSTKQPILKGYSIIVKDSEPNPIFRPRATPAVTKPPRRSLRQGRRSSTLRGVVFPFSREGARGRKRTDEPSVARWEPHGPTAISRCSQKFARLPRMSNPPPQPRTGNATNGGRTDPAARNASL